MFIDSLLKPKSEEDIIRDLNKLTQEEKDKKLLEASLKGQLEEVKLLIEVGADVNVKDEFGYTPLMEASTNDQIEVIKLLIESGADVNAKNKFKNTALARAYMYGYEEIFDLLKNYGAK